MPATPLCCRRPRFSTAMLFVAATLSTACGRPIAKEAAAPATGLPPTTPDEAVRGGTTAPHFRDTPPFPTAGASLQGTGSPSAATVTPPPPVFTPQGATPWYGPTHAAPSWGPRPPVRPAEWPGYSAAHTARTVGIVVLGLSGGALIGGGVAAYSFGMSTGGGGSSPDAARMALFVALGGLIALPIGIAITVLSATDMKAIEKKHGPPRQAASLGVLVGPGSVMLTGKL